MVPRQFEDQLPKREKSLKSHALRGGIIKLKVLKSKYYTTFTSITSYQSIPSQAIQLSMLILHISLILLWISSIHYNVSSTSNYTEYLINPQTVGLSTIPYSVYSQDILSIPGIPEVSSVHHIFHALGYTSSYQISIARNYLLIISLLLLVLGATVSCRPSLQSYLSKKVSTIAIHQQCILLGLGSISWSGHLYHVSIPTSVMLEVSSESSLGLDSLDLLSASTQYYQVSN